MPIYWENDRARSLRTKGIEGAGAGGKGVHRRLEVRVQCMRDFCKVFIPWFQHGTIAKLIKRLSVRSITMKAGSMYFEPSRHIPSFSRKDELYEHWKY